MASTELSLECKVQSYSMLLKYSMGDQQPPSPADQSFDRLRDFVSRLEQERLKIDVFKRELPLCMQLLTNAVETSRRQLQACDSIQVTPQNPVLEEFIPLKNLSSSSEDHKPPTISDKANWLTSVQLWSQATDVTSKQTTAVESPKESNLELKQRINGGAFHPFNKDRDEMELLDKAAEKNENSVEIAAELGAVQTTSCTTTSTSQTHRKTRRCWSPDLHRRFVNALQMLGGSQVATPKQIRELMKVDGLTNDEVKSHLQKYRLHTRRPGPNTQAAGGPAAQLVVLGVGGIWVPPEYAAAAAAAQNGAAALYGPAPTAHPASQFYRPASVPAPLIQELYTTTPPHQLPSFHHQLQLNKGEAPQTRQSSPESEMRAASDSVEEGGENGDERGKVSCGLR